MSGLIKMAAKRTMTHKGYSGSIEFSLEDKCLFGQIMYINDIITYEGQTIEELEKEFRAAVGRYLNFCRTNQKTPDKPFSGSFNIRISPELHKAATIAAHQTGTTLNDFVKCAIESFVSEKEMKQVEHIHKIVFCMEKSEVIEGSMQMDGVNTTWRPQNATLH